MKKTLQEAVDLIIGRYNPVTFAVYAILLVGIEDSKHGEFHFTIESLLLKMSFYTGRRPTRVSRKVIRTAINKLWENGIFEFNPSSKGNIARLPKGDEVWKTRINIV